VRAAALQRNAAARRNRLVGLGAGTTAEERDAAQAEFDVARADHQQAILQAEANLAAARHRQAALAVAEQKLADTRVVVPDDAAKPQAASEEAAVEYVVAQRSVSEGEIVRTMPGDTSTLFRLVIDRPLKLQATVPERHRGEVKVGQAAELAVEAYPGEAFAGTVARVNPTVDRASRTFQVEVHVPNPDRRLSPGSFAKVTIRTKTDPAAPTVPEEALVRFAGVTKVFTVRDGAAVAVPVRAGAGLTVNEGGRSRTWVEVEGELPAGAAVVTSGQTKLADGTAVTVRQ
jgi:RND family efflux transporter MFP subunit